MRKQNDYTLLAVLLVILIAVLTSCNNGIIKKTKSKGGISAIYVQNKDTFALDYLSKSEYDSLKSVLKTESPYYYNAYSPLYDEYFILKSYKPLQNKEIVWFDDKATAVNYSTEYVAMIISPYNK